MPKPTTVWLLGTSQTPLTQNGWVWWFSRGWHCTSFKQYGCSVQFWTLVFGSFVHILSGSIKKRVNIFSYQGIKSALKVVMVICATCYSNIKLTLMDNSELQIIAKLTKLEERIDKYLGAIYKLCHLRGGGSKVLVFKLALQLAWRSGASRNRDYYVQNGGH